MALGDTYIDVEELKSRLEIDDTAGSDRLIGAVLSASRGIEKFCNRQFNDAGSASARVYRPDSRCGVRVDDFCTVTGLVVKSDDDNDGVFETTWSAVDYQCEPLNGVVDGESGWPFWTISAVGNRVFPCYRRASVQVTARWGWDEVPAAVTEACRIAAEEVFKLRDTPFGVGGYGDFGVIRVRDNPFTARMLNPYRRDALLGA
jgi:hypothetical protein